MVCRASRASSAVVTFARDMSGLADNQVLGLNHALMQEGSQTPAPTQEQWNTLITDLQNRYRAGQLTISPGSHDPIDRLEAARAENPDGPRYYAMQRLVERSTAAAAAQTGYFNDFARDAGQSVQAAQAQFLQAFNDASASARTCASPAFTQAWLANPDHSGLPIDRRSLYAFEQMEITRAAAGENAEIREVASQVWEFPADPEGHGRITRIAYDPDSGHTEMSWTREGNSGLTHIYRDIPLEYIMELTNGSLMSREEFFRANISGQAEYRYANRAEAEAARFSRRCVTCGQFTGMAGHACPPNGSEEALNRDTRLAVDRARAAASGEQATAPEIFRVANNGTRRYDVDNGSIRIPGVTRLTQEARDHGVVVTPVHASIDGYAVTGLAQVEYNGRGNGYTVTAVTQPGDSGRDRLQCTCAAWRANSTCEHLNAALSGLARTVGGTARVTPAQAATANATVTSQLAGEFAASVNAADAATRTFTPSAIKLEENPEIFQEMYADARAKRAAWQEGGAFPLDYATENAFGGLATRASGRGFGIEIEFAFPSDMSYQDKNAALAAIGQELYASGLTRNQRQQGYGATHGWYRDHHARGWSFESDPTTGGDQQGGGEIVSPVMFDEPETWQALQKVCDVIKAHGGTFSTGSGMHVHVSTGDYDHQVDNHNRLLNQFAENEDLVYRMSANPIRGRHRGRGFCSPNRMESDPYTSVQSAARGQTGHHIALNLQSVSGRRTDHVEFRTFDSSIEPAVMQAQIGMAVLMVDGALRGVGSTSPAENRQALGYRLNANPSRGNLTGEQWKESTVGVRRFIDRMVPGITESPKDNPIARQIVGLFAMTKWQGVRRRNDNN